MTVKILSIIQSGVTDTTEIMKAAGCSEWTVYRVAAANRLMVSRPRTFPQSESETVATTISNGKYEHLRVSRLVMRRVFGCSMTPRNFECVAVPEGVLIRKVTE